MNKLFLVFLFLVSGVLKAEEGRPCGTAEILSGDSCQNLKIKFDLSSCHQNSDGQPVLSCDENEGKAVVKVGSFLYEVQLKKTWGETWLVNGQVREVQEKKSKALLGPVPGPASSPTPITSQELPASSLLDKLSFKGVARMRTEVSDRTDLLTERAFAQFRVRTDFLFTPDPGVSLFFQPQFAKILGEPAYVGSSTSINTLQDTSGNGYDSFLGVHQAYFDLRPKDWIQFTLGRQILAYGDDLVIGSADWGVTGRSFDGIRLKFKYGLGWSDFFITKIKDMNTTSTVTVGDKDFYGLYQSWDLGEWLKIFEFYVLYLRDGSVSGSPLTSLGTFGLRVQSSHEAIDYKMKINKQIQMTYGLDGVQGSNIQADAEFGLTADLSFKPRLALEGFYSTKDYNQLYPSFHKWLGYADVLGMRNVLGYSVHSSAMITRNLKLALDFHSFFRTDLLAPAYKLNGTTPLGSASASSSSHIGNEFDLVFSHQTTKNLNLSGGVALFLSGDYITSQFSYNTPYFYYLQMELKF